MNEPTIEERTIADMTARIVELEAENKRQREHIRELDESAHQQAEQAEAEVRTVKAHLSQRDVLLQEAEAALAEMKRYWGKTAADKEKATQRAEQAEAHAADCKRLVTACENDIDMLRLRCREHEARYSDVVAEHENELALRLEAEAENRELTLRLNDQRTTAAALRKVASEAEATVERLTFLYEAATGPQQRADLERRWAERGGE